MSTHQSTQDVTTTIRITSSQHQIIKEIAAAEQRTFSAQVRVAIQEHLDRRTQEAA